MTSSHSHAKKAMKTIQIGAAKGNLWDQPPSQLKVLERTPEERWDNGRDSQHLSHDCEESAAVQFSIYLTAALPVTQGVVWCGRDTGGAG